jgi:diguanylate cyclase (GGDEF)-like protein
VAGLIVGIGFLQATWRRSGPHPRDRCWLTAWLVLLASLFLANGILEVTDNARLTDILLFLRSQSLAGTVLLAVPSITTVIGGRPPRLVLWIAGGLYVLRATLWLTTDLVFAHMFTADGMPVYGSLIAVASLLPAAVVFSSVTLSIMRMPGGRLRTLLATAGGGSAVLLAASYAVPSAHGSELLSSLWAVPLVLLLHLMVVRGVREAERLEQRVARSRADQTILSNSVWFQREPQAMLAEAEQMARVLLNDPDLTGTVRRLARGNHVVGLYPSASTVVDDVARRYLDALTRIVTTAADQHAMAADMRRASLTDTLTKLPNRPALEAFLRGALAHAEEEACRLAVLFCDIDDFKKVNDEHGHPRGDAILVEAAGRLWDVVGESAYVARFGGDEFVVVVPDAGSDDDLLKLARQLRNVLTPHGPGSVDRPSLSVGVVTWTLGEDRDPYRLLRDADTAMYGAKASREGILVFDPSLRERMLAEIESQNALSRGVAAGEIEAFFQPVVGAVSRTIHSYEALARWRHAGVLRPPSEWLPLAEKSGLIVQIGLEMLRQARLQSDATGLPVAVNVAPRQLSEPGFVDDVCEAWGRDACDRLVLEITESALLDDVSSAQVALSQLRALGVRVALDDFGTGYSSIALLGGLPIDVLKIDRAFVCEVLSPRGRAVICAILSLADAFSLDVIAEGVELEAELGALNELGSMEIQGYLTGRPAAPAEATAGIAASA